MSDEELQPTDRIRPPADRARLSCEALIGELESQLEKSGKYTTKRELAIVKTLMNHMNKLQDRIETLEGQIQDMQRDQKIKPECEEAMSPVKKAKTSPVATAGAEHGEPDHKTVSTQKELSRLWQCL